jgi:hypothetical protein
MQIEEHWVRRVDRRAHVESLVADVYCVMWNYGCRRLSCPVLGC